MLVSRQYLGVILIALVFSTILTSFMIGERPDRPVEVIKNDAPYLDLSSDSRFGYSFTVVFRKDFDEVKVKFGWLIPATTLLLGEENATSFEELLPNMVKLRALEAMLLPLDTGPETITEGFPESLVSGSDRAVLLDYADALSAAMKDQAHLVRSLYLFVFNGSTVRCYEGISDFFPEREWYPPRTRAARDPRGSGSIEFGIDEDRTTYVSLGEKKLYPQLPTLDQLPPYGELVFNNVRKDQRMTVMTFIQGRSVGFWNNMELIRIYLDGKLEFIQINNPQR